MLNFRHLIQPDELARRLHLLQKKGKEKSKKEKTHNCHHCLILSSCLVWFRPTIPGDSVETVPVGILVIALGYNVSH